MGEKWRTVPLWWLTGMAGLTGYAIYPRQGKLHVHQCHAQKTFEIFDALLTVIVSPDLDLYTTRPEIHLAFT